jgi:hypothetical protein
VIEPGAAHRVTIPVGNLSGLGVRAPIAIEVERIRPLAPLIRRHGSRLDADRIGPDTLRHRMTTATKHEIAKPKRIFFVFWWWLPSRWRWP